MTTSSKDKTQRKILRLSIMATVILLASVLWVNYDRNIRHGDKTLTFDGQPLTEILRIVEETYDVDIKITDVDLSSCMVSGKFVDKTLEDMLGYLNSKYKLELERLAKREFVVKGGDCK